MILALQMSHFTAAVTFAFFVSIVYGITQRDTPRDMLRYFGYCFAMFLVLMFIAGWIMWFLHH